MGCCGDREKESNATNEQKWDYINLSDFRSSSCLTPLSYGILYILLIISVAVYAVDLFTCANLLLFDKWSGQVKPVIPFEISRWIFAGCIILSWVLLAYRWWRAVRAMKTGVVAASYLDPLAVRVQSVRMGSRGRGWRRFLVFTALTKGRKGAEYVALFTYFSFEAWLRICFAEGPRQVINALTLYSVMQADLVPVGDHAATKGHTPIVQFFVNVQILAGKEKEQAAILFGMLFTLIIWIFSALSLLLAIIFYIVFLWHHIREGSLSKYCRRKIDTRLHQIVKKKVNKALNKEYKARTKQEDRDIKAGIFKEPAKRQPTLPVLDTEGDQNIAPISRQTTHTEISPFDSRPPSRSTSFAQDTLSREPIIPNVLSREPTVPGVPGRRPTVPDVLTFPARPQPPSRQITQSSLHSNASYADDAPLIGSAAAMGYNRSESRGGPTRMDSGLTMSSSRPPPGRSVTGSSQGTQRTFNSASSRMGPPFRTITGMSGRTFDSSASGMGYPARTNTDMSGRTKPAAFASRPPPRKHMPQNTSFNPNGRSPGPPGVSRRPTQEYEMQTQPATYRGNEPFNEGGYVAFDPNVYNAFGPTPLSGPPSSRNLTQPQRPPPTDYFGSIERPAQRSGTAPIPQTAAYGIATDDGYGGTWQQPRAGPAPYRPATTDPAGRRPGPPRY